MLQTATTASDQKIRLSQSDEYLRVYRCMLTARLLDEKLASLYRAGKIYGGVFLGKGQEALSVALGWALKKGDIYAPLIRDGAGRLAFGESVVDALRNCIGSALGPMRARDGNVHRGRPREGYIPMISHLGAMISVVVGALQARRMKGETGGVGATCLGDGGTSTGSFHEALNLAAIENLPLVLVIANNQYAYSTPTSRQFACRALVDKAIGYGVSGVEVDGTDFVRCLDVIGSAVHRARNGEGPQLIVGDLLRLCGHGEHDDASYIDSKLKGSKVGRDCLKVAEHFLAEHENLSFKQIDELSREVSSEIEEAVAKVQNEPGPEPFNHDWCALASRHLQEVYESA